MKHKCQKIDDGDDYDDDDDDNDADDDGDDIIFISAHDA